MAGKKTDGWSRRFERPIPLPDGRRLVTLRDAGNYIAKLPGGGERAAALGNRRRASC